MGPGFLELVLILEWVRSSQILAEPPLIDFERLNKLSQLSHFNDKYAYDFFILFFNAFYFFECIGYSRSLPVVKVNYEGLY